MYRAILLEPEYEGNIGFVARLVENFGIDELALVDPECEMGEEARDRASHAQGTLEEARIVDDLEPVIEDLDYLAGTTGIQVSEDNVLRDGVPPEMIAEEVPDEASVGVMFGREGKGLSNEELDLCDFTVKIPTSEDYPVMNLSHAAAVVFYEIFKNREEDGSDDARPSSRREREVLENLYKGVTERLGWEERRQEKALRAFRNVLGRSYITDRELQFLLGTFRETRDELGED
ncbi:MAG: RNA methyltransferase [Candidatus Nanohaloarchaea archaeon]